MNGISLRVQAIVQREGVRADKDGDNEYRG